MITLGIIGVVAALTMPTLINDTKNMQYVVGLKKANSVLSQANELVQIDNPSSNWDIKDGDFNKVKAIYELFKPHLKITKDCGCGVNVTGCWSDDVTKALNGKNYHYTYASGGKSEVGGNICAVRLADGMNIIFDMWSDKNLGIESSSLVFFYVNVDVNGDKKPNMLGKDVFLLAILPEKGTLVPAGIEGNSPLCKVSDTTDFAGLDCAAKVLKEGKISY